MSTKQHVTDLTVNTCFLLLISKTLVAVSFYQWWMKHTFAHIFFLAPSNSAELSEKEERLEMQTPKTENRFRNAIHDQ